ncbi:unnamed protein product, partial [Ostreobium quekettii]
VVALHHALFVTSLDISLNPRITWRGAAALSELLDTVNIKQHARHQSAIESSPRPPPCLRRLALDGLPIGDAGGRALCDRLICNDALTRLSARGCGIGAASAGSLGWMLQENATLEVLRIGWNSLGALGAAKLSSGLRANGTLRILELSYNGLGQAGASHVGRALVDNGGLTELDLSSNGVGSRACSVIADALSRNTRLAVLHLNSNPLGGDGGRRLLQTLAGSDSLKRIALQGSTFADDPIVVSEKIFSRRNPNGKYTLDLKDPSHRQLVAELVSLRQCQGESTWQQAQLNAQPLDPQIIDDWTERLPEEGVLQVAFAAAEGPPLDVLPITEGDFQCVRQEMSQEGASDYWRLTLIQLMTGTFFFSAAQVDRVVAARLLEASAKEGHWRTDPLKTNFRNVLVDDQEVEVENPATFQVPKRGYMQLDYVSISDVRSGKAPIAARRVPVDDYVFFQLVGVVQALLALENSNKGPAEGDASGKEDKGATRASKRSAKSKSKGRGKKGKKQSQLSAEEPAAQQQGEETSGSMHIPLPSGNAHSQRRGAIMSPRAAKFSEVFRKHLAQVEQLRMSGMPAGVAWRTILQRLRELGVVTEQFAAVWDGEMPSLAPLDVVRSFSSRVFVRCDQVIDLLAVFGDTNQAPGYSPPSGSARVELIQIVFCRIVDLNHFASVLKKLPPEEQTEVHRRLGVLNTVPMARMDHLHLDGLHFCLRLHRGDEAAMCAQMCTVAAGVPRGQVFRDTCINGCPMSIPENERMMKSIVKLGRRVQQPGALRKRRMLQLVRVAIRACCSSSEGHLPHGLNLPAISCNKEVHS